MARFLSSEWLDELTAASSGLAGGGAFIVIEQVVSDGPDGEVRYHVVVDDQGIRFLPGPAPEADATFRQDYRTAADLAAGRITPQEAFFSGRVKVSGNTAALVENQEVLAVVAQAVGAVRRTTDFP